jgi:hypothetical protein
MQDFGIQLYGKTCKDLFEDENPRFCRDCPRDQQIQCHGYTEDQPKTGFPCHHCTAVFRSYSKLAAHRQTEHKVYM